MAHRLLCVHPHPDDEAIACGGLIARTLHRGASVTIVTCTGGEEGENQSGIDLDGRSMDEVRRDEMAAALDALGGPDHVWLGYRDSGMDGEPANDHPDAFHAADLDEAASRLAAVIRDVRPHVVVSDDRNGTYGHPDHVKAYWVTARAVELAAADADGAAGWVVPKRYVHALTKQRAWTLFEAMRAQGLPTPFADEDEQPQGPHDLPFGVDAGEVTTVVDVHDVLDVKRAAMAAHRSQIGEESFFLNTPDELARVAFGVEEFVLVEGDAAVGPDGREHDVFAGVPA